MTIELQPQRQGARAHPPAVAPNLQPSGNRPPAAAEPETEEPPSPTSSTSSSQHPMETAEDVAPSQVQEATPPAAASNAQNAPPLASNAQKANATTSGTSSQSSATKAEAMQVEAAPSSTNENANPPVKETNMDEAIRVTRARLRKSRSGPKS